MSGSSRGEGRAFYGMKISVATVMADYPLHIDARGAGGWRQTGGRARVHESRLPRVKGARVKIGGVPMSSGQSEGKDPSPAGDGENGELRLWRSPSPGHLAELDSTPPEFSRAGECS